MPFEADILIAQSAYDADPGVSALAIGWQIRPADPIPWAVLISLRATRDLIGTDHTLRVQLEREDGSPVLEDEVKEVEFEVEFDVQGLSDVVAPINLNFGFNLLPVPLPPDEEFRFRLLVDGESRDHWVAHFRTYSEPPE
jgi:hypothetical protein